MSKKRTPKEEVTNETLLNEQAFSEVISFFENNKDAVPESIMVIIITMIEMIKKTQENFQQKNKLLEILRTYMGFTHSKERESKSEERSKAPEWSPEREKKLSKLAKDAVDKLREYKKNRPKKKKKPPKKGDSSKNTSGQTEAASSLEPVFQPAVSQGTEETKDVNVPQNEIPSDSKNLIRSFNQRTRYDASLVITKITYNVETVQDPVTGFSKTAKVDEGPSRYRVTWNGIAQIILLIVGTGIPLVRLASSFSSVAAYFSPSRLYRLCLYAAQALAAVYFEIFRQLANCDVLSGDDTNNEVLEMRRDMPELSEEQAAEKTEGLIASKNEEDPQKADLMLEAEELLGAQERLKKKEGLKKAVYTSVVIGQYLDKDPGSMLIFYHSERKTFGDLLGKILALRKTGEKKNITIQSDLSSNNTPNPLPDKFNIITAGCAAHARRCFWRRRHDNDDMVVYYCYTLILLFDKIFDSDREARELGCPEKLLLARKNEQASLWQKLKEHCEKMPFNLAPNSDMCSAAKYVTKNYATLTRYLTDARLRPDNNMAERLLRSEKIMLANSKFRVSRKGRLVYDILRTILANCAANQVDCMPYIVHVLKNQIDARKNPTNYTPHFYAKQKKPA